MWTEVGLAVAVESWQMAVLVDCVQLFERYTNKNGIFDQETVGRVLKILLLSLASQPLKSWIIYTPMYFITMVQLAETGIWAYIQAGSCIGMLANGCLAIAFHFQE